MAKRKDIFKQHANLRFLSIVFLSLFVILGVVWYVNSYSERSSAAGQKPNKYCRERKTGEMRCKGSQLCPELEYYTQPGVYPNRCNLEGKKFARLTEECAHSDRCDPGGNNPPNDGEAPPPASYYQPKGYIDGADETTCSVWGWTCDQDYFAKSLKIRILAGRNIVGETVAKINAPDVAGACGGNAKHRFHYYVPNDSFIRGTGEYEIDVSAVDINSLGQETGGSKSIQGNNKYNLRCSKYPTPTLAPP